MCKSRKPGWQQFLTDLNPAAHSIEQHQAAEY
jgi:hypothetical protein